MTRGFELITRGFELVTRGYELLIRRFELVTRNSCFIFPRLGLPFHGPRDDSKYHPKVGEYSTGRVGNL